MPPPTPASAVVPRTAKPPLGPDAHEPELYPPAWKTVGVGQTISFSTSVIDQDLDVTSATLAKHPASATFDPITQTVTWTPTAADRPAASFTVAIAQPERGKTLERTFSIAVAATPQPAPTAPVQSPLIETLLLIRQPERLAQVNHDWPIDRLLEVGAATFALQFPDAKRKLLRTTLDGATAYKQMLTGLAQVQRNPRLDPASPQFDRAAFGDAKSWKIVAFRPRIDKQWSELRVVYRAMNAPEPVFAMFRLRPVVEYVPALPRPGDELDADNQVFLAMVAKRLMKAGGPNPAFDEDIAGHAAAVSRLLTDVMTYDATTTAKYRHGFLIGLAMEARMGGGSVRDAAGHYVSGDGWGWSAMKPFQTADGTGQAYVNIAIPGFWTDLVPGKARTHDLPWQPRCAPRFDVNSPDHVPGYDALCRKTMGLVDLPELVNGKIANGKLDATNLYVRHKQTFMVDHLPLADGRRDVGEENGMTCSQCHIRNFGMHDWRDPATNDPDAGTPKALNHALPTVDFQIIPTTTWEPFTLEFLDYQECRAKMMLELYLGADAARHLTCPLANR